MRYFSLFSGIGGFELGIERAAVRRYGWQESTDWSHLPRGRDCAVLGSIVTPSCVGFSEIDRYAAQIYQTHFPNHKNYGDITTIDASELPDFELLVGGFPCQAFSLAGKRGGFADTRGTLFFEIARIAKRKKPRLLLLENVKGLLSHAQGTTFAIIISTLDELGYDVQWQVLNSKNHGVPQNRERVFIVGHLRGTPRPEVFPISETNAVRSEPEAAEKEVHDIASTQTARQYASWNGNFVEGETLRRLTPVECERLQGFPDGWTEGVSDTQRYKCLGNAVTVNVIEVIVDKII